MAHQVSLPDDEAGTEDRQGSYGPYHQLVSALLGYEAWLQQLGLLVLSCFIDGNTAVCILPKFEEVLVQVRLWNGVYCVRNQSETMNLL